MSTPDDIPPRPPTALYLITPPRLEDEANFISILKDALATGKVAALQLRFKLVDNTTIDKDTTRRIANAIMPDAQAAETAVFVNDDVELAVKLGADGVHLGRQDMSIKQARALLPDDMIIGCLLYTSPSPRDLSTSRMPSSA